VGSGNNNSDRNSTLPSPELNPLLNPVLGAHMGRWAEVYFTAPPEKREEAVLELLRELQGEKAAKGQTQDSSVAKPPETPVKQPRIETGKRERQVDRLRILRWKKCVGQSILWNVRLASIPRRCGSP
jgi:hypothetical protein